MTAFTHQIPARTKRQREKSGTWARTTTSDKGWLCRLDVLFSRR